MFSTFAQSSAANVKIGVPENYDGIFPWYLAKVRDFTLFYIVIKEKCN